MLTTSFLLGAFLAIGLLTRRYSKWTRALMLVITVVGIVLLMRGN